MEYVNGEVAVFVEELGADRGGDSFSRDLGGTVRVVGVAEEAGSRFRVDVDRRARLGRVGER
ncbi:hypothetical protein [Micromonospora sp. NPDC005173]|uniref:hypothetical protein n=1 Tax=Micromonospora sp. NPDC005173 TaxID=3157165 RepID=UPI0033BF34D0